MNQPNVGDTLAYYAEPNSKEEPYSGPFPARVTAVHPAKEAEEGREAKDRKPAEPLRVDLQVKFSAAPTEHTKTGVLVTDEPAKHCATASPYSFDFDSWFEELAEQERQEKGDVEPEEEEAEESDAEEESA